MTGYEDLDDYGRWRYVSDYGPVWIPASIPVGWAPYRYGHWVWIRPWGWTWVDDEPWGFAPFHYGRWAYVENGWCWVPVLWSCGRSTRRRWWFSLATRGDSVVDQAWAGFRWRQARSLCRLIVSAACM